MTARFIAGSCVAYGYNSLIGHLPLHSVRRAYLALYLGGIGAGSSVQLNCRFLNGRKVFLGERNVINFGTLLDGRSYRIDVGDDVSIGPEASILTLGHDPQSPAFDCKGGDVFIGSRAWIGYRAVILPGVRIGEGAVVAAGAVVTRDIAPYTIAAGVPAREVGTRRRDLTYRLRFEPFLG